MKKSAIPIGIIRFSSNCEYVNICTVRKECFRYIPGEAGMKSMRGIEIMEQNGKTRSKRSAIIIMGLALFATQFGAGNLIFPPFLGRDTGSSWFVGFIGFFLMDVVLAV